MSSHPVPISDFNPFLNESAKQQAANQLLASFKLAGFVYLTNFSIPDGDVQEMFDLVSYPPPDLLMNLNSNLCS